MEQQLSKKINGDKVKCLLCPHFCVLKKEQIGKCHARFSDGETISHIKSGAISCLAIEPIEKKPFKHFLQGTKTLTSGNMGCPFSCKYCENFSISQKSNFKDSKVLSSSEIVNIAIEKGCGSISLSYNEPTVDYEHLISLAEESVLNGLPFVLKTNAFVNKEPWKEICRVSDAMNIDWKGSEEKFRFITGVDSYVLRDRIKEAYEAGVHIEVSLPLYYKDDELEEEVNIVGKFLSSISKDIPCHLLSIQPSYKYSDFIFDYENMRRAKSILFEYMNNIYEVD